LLSSTAIIQGKIHHWIAALRSPKNHLVEFLAAHVLSREEL